MTTEAIAPVLAGQSDDELLAMLGDLRGVIDAGQAAFATRLAIFRILSARGIPQRRIGDASGITGNAVGYALHTHGR